MAKSAKIDYGVDSPRLLRTLLVLGGLGVLAGPFLPTIPAKPIPLPLGILVMGLWGMPLLTLAALIFFHARWGKFKLRRMAAAVRSWRGDEKCLDLGTGRGLLLLAFAQRLGKGGKVLGLDLWKPDELSGNSPESAHENIVATGLGQRAEVKTADFLVHDLGVAAFDVIGSVNSLGRLPEKSFPGLVERLTQASRPGATLVFAEDAPTRAILRSLLEDKGYLVTESAAVWGTFPMCRVLSAEKAG